MNIRPKPHRNAAEVRNYRIIFILNNAPNSTQEKMTKIMRNNIKVERTVAQIANYVQLSSGLFLGPKPACKHLSESGV